VRNIDYFRNKQVTVVGLARSGLACARLMVTLGARVRVTDNQDTPAIREHAGLLQSSSIPVELGRHTPEFIEGSDFVITSPGVTSASIPVALADKQHIPVISEVEAGWILCPATIIAVTGSAGKTTVTTLIGSIIEASGRKAYVCGNIGTPFCSQVQHMGPEDIVSLEVSSFQLERIKNFKPRIAVMLNINRNHLDRHRDMQEYLDAKKNIFRNQDEGDFLVLNRDCPVLVSLAHEARGTVVYFNRTKELNPNQAAVAKVAAILGIDRKTYLSVFSGFKGLEHRLEYVAGIRGVTFINDSKATLAESTIWALENIQSPIILIAGGRDKDADYSGIIPSAKNKVKQVILIGQAKEKIAAALKGDLALAQAQDLPEAVRRAFACASPGDCVLLSPMCSSFDMFSSYEERGRVFKEAVRALEKNLTPP
jgi:UDP-N-acetylmuramoylalanine--D-glutamate ligase